MGSHTIETAETPSHLQPTLDVPHQDTGTGTALVLDGHDSALVRVTIVDSHGRVVPWANTTVHFRVTRGPGRIVAVGNGDPACHEPSQASWRSAYHGAVRVVVQVTEDCSSAQRQELGIIDVEGGQRTVILEECPHDSAIEVEASAEGFAAVSLKIPVSRFPEKDSPLAVAQSGASADRLLDHYNDL